jgi:cytochrome c oxidase cbb3-type subunit I/II
MVFSVMLWMPSWGGMINGLLTLRGAWKKVSTDPVLKFFVVGVTFYGMSTFEGPLMSIKSVNSLSHYTDWTIGHVHGGALGWVGFMTFGMVYWLAPRLFQTDKLYSVKLATWHFWLATIGIVLYVVSMWTAGITQGLMWRAFDDNGSLAHRDFIDTVVQLIPMYWVRALGGSMYIVGVLIAFYNLFKTWQMRPETYEEVEHEAAPLVDVDAKAYIGSGGLVSRLRQAKWHRRWEGLPARFSVYVVVAVAVASLFEIIPTFVIKSNVPTISTVKPYSPLELAGRDIYIREGCYNCHSQMVRPFIEETVRYGEYSKPGEFIYDRPFQWGSRRIGPDLHRVGGTRTHNWHVRHMNDPRSTSKDSIMPPYSWLLENDLDFDSIQSRIDALVTLGTPYDEDAKTVAGVVAEAEAELIAAEIVEQGGPPGLEKKEIVALIAYLQRLGTDIKSAPASERGVGGGK